MSSQWPAGPPTQASVTHPSAGFGPAVVLLVMSLASFASSGIPDAFAHSTAGDGEGEGDLGVLKLYVSSQVQGLLLALGLVLLAGAIAALVVALVRRARAR